MTDEHPAAKKMREQFEAKYGDMSNIMRAINGYFYTVEQFRRPYNSEFEDRVTNADLEKAEADLLASIRAEVALLSASKPAAPEGWKLVPDHADADAIVTSLYRRFKDWSKRGFGPDDVTWCEVKADVLAMLAASPAAPAQSADLPSTTHKIQVDPSAAGYHINPPSEFACEVAKIANRASAASQPSRTAVVLDDERAAFEAWYAKVKITGDVAWMAWMASQARAASAQSCDCGPNCLDKGAIEGCRYAEPAQPVEQTPEPVAYRYRHSLGEKWQYGPTPRSFWECQPLYVAQPATPNPMLDKAERDISASQPVKLAQPVEQISPIIGTQAPFSNCRFKFCDLPGQCRDEGKCHHPAVPAAQPVEQTAAQTFTPEQMATLFVALGNFESSGSKKCAASIRSILEMHCGDVTAAPAQSGEAVRLSESDVAALYSSSAHDPLSGFTAKLNAALDRVGPQPSQTAVALDDERAAFERALFELVNKIDTGLDTGDLLKDARRASAALDSILSHGDLVACAHEYFRDSGERYEKSIEFRIGWNACLDAIANARAATPQPVAQPVEKIVDVSDLFADRATVIRVFDFYKKHAIGSLAAPSCLCCGRSTQDVEVAIKHMELPDIVVCAECHRAIAQPVEQTRARGSLMVCPNDWSALPEGRGYGHC